MTPASYQLLHPAIFRAFNTAYFTSLFVFILYAYRRGSGPGLPDLHLFVTQTSTALSKTFCGRRRIRTSEPFLTATLAMWCFRPLSHSSVRRPSLGCHRFMPYSVGIISHEQKKVLRYAHLLYIMAAFALLFHIDSRSPYPWWKDSPCSASRYSPHYNGCVPGLRQISSE